MSLFKRIGRRLRKNVKYSASDPKNFDEIWSFQSTSIRLISLILIVLIIVGVGSAYLFSGFFGGFGDDRNIQRTEVEDQRVQIEELKAKIDSQEEYIENIRMILSGEVPMNIENDSIVNLVPVNLDSLRADQTSSEKELSDKIKDDLRTPNDSKDKKLMYFASPAIGVVSQAFDKSNHPGIDVVTPKDYTVKACLAGTIIYAGYTRKDGNILIVEHAGGFTSVYKHNKTVLKKLGTKVQLGDPIAIVGNSGENTDGPHLHFELWYNQTPVNPTDYIKFTK